MTTAAKNTSISNMKAVTKKRRRESPYACMYIPIRNIAEPHCIKEKNTSSNEAIRTIRPEDPFRSVSLTARMANPRLTMLTADNSKKPLRRIFGIGHVSGSRAEKHR